MHGDWRTSVQQGVSPYEHIPVPSRVGVVVLVKHLSATGAYAVKRPKPNDDWFANNLHAWGLTTMWVHPRLVPSRVGESNYSAMSTEEYLRSVPLRNRFLATNKYLLNPVDTHLKAVLEFAPLGVETEQVKPLDLIPTPHGVASSLTKTMMFSHRG
jgi:hypothetical protein